VTLLKENILFRGVLLRIEILGLKIFYNLTRNTRFSTRTTSLPNYLYLLQFLLLLDAGLKCCGKAVDLKVE
jgi:hypothetical protein